MATNQHATTEEPLEVMFSLALPATVAIKRRSKHAPSAIFEVQQ
jgi:hypothetical protein